MQSPRTPHVPESSNQELGAMDACFCHVFAKVVQLFPGETNWRLGQSLEDECGCHIDWAVSQWLGWNILESWLLMAFGFSPPIPRGYRNMEYLSISYQSYHWSYHIIYLVPNARREFVTLGDDDGSDLEMLGDSSSAPLHESFRMEPQNSVHLLLVFFVSKSCSLSFFVRFHFNPMVLWLTYRHVRCAMASQWHWNVNVATALQSDPGSLLPSLPVLRHLPPRPSRQGPPKAKPKRRRQREQGELGICRSWFKHIGAVLGSMSNDDKSAIWSENGQRHTY